MWDPQVPQLVRNFLKGGEREMRDRERERESERERVRESAREKKGKGGREQP
jgi:hypothetical protein